MKYNRDKKCKSDECFFIDVSFVRIIVGINYNGIKKQLDKMGVEISEYNEKYNIKKGYNDKLRFSFYFVY